MPATTRPPVSASSMANSSATRTGFKIGIFEPSSAILARLTRWVSAPAMTIGLGVSDIGAKWCSASVTQSKPSWSASSNCSRLVSIERSATSAENDCDGTGHMPRGAGPMYGTDVKMAAFTSRSRCANVSQYGLNRDPLRVPQGGICHGQNRARHRNFTYTLASLSRPRCGRNTPRETSATPSSPTRPTATSWRFPQAVETLKAAGTTRYDGPEPFAAAGRQIQDRAGHARQHPASRRPGHHDHHQRRPGRVVLRAQHAPLRRLLGRQRAAHSARDGAGRQPDGRR